MTTTGIWAALSAPRRRVGLAIMSGTGIGVFTFVLVIAIMVSGAGWD